MQMDEAREASLILIGLNLRPKMFTYDNTAFEFENFNCIQNKKVPKELQGLCHLEIF